MEQSLGARITFHRKQLGLTQEKMAEQLGVTAQAVSKWENDQTCPDITTLPKLADLFGITTDELLGHCQTKTVFQTEVVDKKDKDKHKFELEMDLGKKHGIALAVWVLLVGSLCVANVFAQWNVSFWDILWPSFLLMLGVSGLIKHFNFFSCGCTLFGAYFLVENLGIWQLDFGKELVFPIIIVLFGLCLLADVLRKPRKSHPKLNFKNKTTCDFSIDAAHFTYALSFGEGSRIIEMHLLSSGDIDCSFGEMTVDLSGCEQISDSCRINADCSFGELILKVPSQYRVEPNSDTTFGNISISGQPDKEPVGIIVLNADVSFGSILVQYI